jgi:hypothetical protein
MAAPTFVDTGAYETTGGGTNNKIDISLTGAGDLDIVGEAADDVAIVITNRESTEATTSVTADWNHFASVPVQQATGGFKYQTDAWWKRLTGTAEALFNVTWTSSSIWRDGIMLVYRGLITTETPVINLTTDVETAQNTQPVHPGITISRSNSGLLFVVANFNDISGGTPPTGFTERKGSSWAARNLVAYDDLTTTTGATGTVTGALGGDVEYPLTLLIELVTEAAGGAAQDTPELYGRPYGLRGTNHMRQILAQ